MDFQRISDAVGETGLAVLGGFHPEPGDQVPGVPGNAKTLILAGNAGPAMWAAFGGATAAEERRQAENPLDDWTRRILEKIAGALGAVALFPFDGPPYLPFQRWALLAGGVHVSPIGPLIHPEYGLWHAYRGALTFAERLDLPDPPGGPSPCESCEAKPCLDACPVGAFTPTQGEKADYDVPACVGHIASPGGKDCLTGGCLARRACPVGRDTVYGPEQAEFHMQRFLKAQTGG